VDAVADEVNYICNTRPWLALRPQKGDWVLDFDDTHSIGLIKEKFHEGKSESLGRLVLRTKRLTMATDHRDGVFALLGIASGNVPTQISPIYHLSTREVCLKVSSYTPFISSQQHTMIIGRSFGALSALRLMVCQGGR